MTLTFISLSFASLDYKNPTSNKYRYKLKDLNQDWINLGSTRQISFTRLPPGNYELTVQGSNSDGDMERERKKARFNC